MYLDSLTLIESQVGYGDLGMNGSLGYEGLPVTVGRKPYAHALSTHPPARLIFQLDGRFGNFTCQVALNDDVPAGRSHAHFFVRADGVEVGCVPYVMAGAPPRDLCANIAGARIIELIVETDAWDSCHALWLDPEVIDQCAELQAQTLDDCLGRAEIELLPPQPEVEYCIATVASSGFESLLDDMLGSLQVYGNCAEALLVVFGIEASDGCRRIAEKYGASFITCHRRGNVNSTVKSILYTAARVVPARKFICLDADMLVLGDLQPIFASVEVAPIGSLFACREANGSRFTRLDRAINYIYGGYPSDLTRLLGCQNGEGAYSLVVNDGLFAGGRTALLTLDGLIRSWTQAQRWVDERRDVWWRNQFIFNLALARLDCGVELDATYNVQLNSQNVSLQRASGRARALWQDRSVRVLHFNGNGRHKYPEWRGKFARVSTAP